MGFNTYPCNPYPISTEELNKGNNDELNARVTALEGEVTDLGSTKANQITIAPFFNSQTAYEVGDLVYYNGLSYRCTNAHEGEWDADDFAATTIAGELGTLKSGLTSVAAKHIKTYEGTVSANDIDTQLLTVADSVYQIITGFEISDTADVLPLQIFFENLTTIKVRVRNIISGETSYVLRVFYV